MQLANWFQILNRIGTCLAQNLHHVSLLVFECEPQMENSDPY